MRHAERLVGKIVTVFTVQTNRDFRAEIEAAGQPLQKYPQQFFNYFLGVLEAIDDDGILIKNTSGLLNYFMKNQIVAICQEELLDPEDPIHKKAIEKMNAAVSQPVKPKPEPNKTVNPAALQEMLKNLNKEFGVKR